jgi:hypothetical protein
VKIIGRRSLHEDHWLAITVGSMATTAQTESPVSSRRFFAWSNRIFESGPLEAQFECVASGCGVRLVESFFLSRLYFVKLGVSASDLVFRPIFLPNRTETLSCESFSCYRLQARGRLVLCGFRLLLLASSKK